MGAKDWLVEKTAVAMLNQSVLKPYGTLTRLKLDSSKRSVEAELELRGETQPVRVQIPEYDLLQKNGGTVLIIKSISTSREWLTTLARDFAVERELKIPPSIEKYLPIVLG
jgi:hypothetical protein